MSSTVEIVAPGLYDYDLKVEFPSVYIPEHTMPESRNAASYPTTRSRYAQGQFELKEAVAHTLLCEYFVLQACQDVDRSIVTVARFDLTPAAR